MIQTLSDALAERGYDTMTPVQEAVTDPALIRADLLVSAQTGSGKTVGFGLAIAPTLLGEDGSFGPAALPLGLVIAPTRELAFQVARELDWLYGRTGARVVACVGGMDMRDERRALDRGAHIVVGTPGRLRDHIQRGSLDMRGLRAVVLDEADEMLDLGFREDLEFMLDAAPADRRTLMFSATVPPTIARLAENYQRDAVRVTTLSDRKQHADIAYQALRVAAHDAENAIINVLRFHEAQNAIVFANTRATVNRLTARFANRGFAVVSLSGELSQAERGHALQAMRDGRARVCVATDVAARGIDLPNLELVIHAELPSNADGLLHRSGRTGRAGRKGISALVVPPKNLARAKRLLDTAGVTAEWIAAPGAEEILRRDEERLLADPAWDVAATDAEADFASRLLERHGPQAIAAAYLRLYRAQHSAPEELSAPEARPAAKERAPFGDGVWIALSVGSEDRAEARWLLPLLCRAGNIEKDVIGAIRVQRTETFVELSAACLPGFLAALGPGGEMEKGVIARRIDGDPREGRTSHPAPGKPLPAPGQDPSAFAPSGAPTPELPIEEQTAAAVAPTPKHAAPAKGKQAGPGRTGGRKTDRTAPVPSRSKPSGAGKPTRPGKPEKSLGSGKTRATPRHDGGKPPHRSGTGGGMTDASDTSKRFVPPGRAPRPKSASGKNGLKGAHPPKRGRS